MANEKPTALTHMGGCTCNEPVHHGFSLSYASYLVMARSIMQSMPVEWQHRMVDLVDEFYDAAGNLDDLPEYRVQAVGERGRFVPDPYLDYERGRRVVELKAPPGPADAEVANG